MQHILSHCKILFPDSLLWKSKHLNYMFNIVYIVWKPYLSVCSMNLSVGHGSVHIRHAVKHGSQYSFLFIVKLRTGYLSVCFQPLFLLLYVSWGYHPWSPWLSLYGEHLPAPEMRELISGHHLVRPTSGGCVETCFWWGLTDVCKDMGTGLHLGV